MHFRLRLSMPVKIRTEGQKKSKNCFGRSWQKIASEFRGSGYPSAPYSYTDLKYQPGGNYYRVAQVLGTGVKKYSDIRSVKINNSNKINIRTNMVNNTIEIYSKYLPTKYVAQIFDMTGRLVFAGHLLKRISQLISAIS
jgi:hypothetical protein